MAADYQYFGWRFEEGKEACHVWIEAINEELIIWKRLSHSTLKLVRRGAGSERLVFCGGAQYVDREIQ